MESNVVESDGRCACEMGPTLGVLNDVHKAYEERMELINRTAGSQKLQKQVQLLQSWVGDLVAQNTLLARTVEELEIELTSRVLSERRKFSEMVSELRVEVTSLRRRLARKDSDLRGLLEVLRRLREFDYRAIDSIHFNEKDKSKKTCDQVNELKIKIDSLQKDNFNKEREIRKLSKDVQQYEHTISNLRNDISVTKYHTPDVSRKDAAVTVEICCSANKECGDVEPVKEYGVLRDEGVQYQEQIQHMESSGESVRTLREVNVFLSEEVQALHRVCAALEEQCRVAALRAQFKDEIVREMRRQLRQAKAKLKEATNSKSSAETSSPSYGSVRRGEERELPDLDMNPDWICQNTLYGGSGDDHAGARTSTPNASQEINNMDTSDVSVVERSLSPPLLITDESITEEDMDGPEISHCPSVRSLAEVVAKHKPTHTGTASTLRSRRPERIRCHCRGRQDSTVAENMSGAERTRCLQDKLHATLQILKNKEETVRVQAESLALAEERLSAFATRTHKATIHRGLQVQPKQNESGNGCKVETTDVSITAQTQAMDEKMVKSLKDNVSVVEDLYRECFYESARQGHLIESLRGSYLQLRLMDKEKDDQLFRLQKVVDTQRSAAFAYQDIASEVDNLKAEISDFLNNSNNDSGMWERGEDCDVTADLRHISEQLHRLRDLLTEECTCGLDEEYKILKRTNELNERLICEFRDRINVLEETLVDKEKSDQRYKTLIAEKEREINDLRKQINGAEKNSQSQCCCKQMSSQLQQIQGSLNDKTLELVHVQHKCEEQSETIRELRLELEAAKFIKEENASVRQEVSKLKCEVTSWRSQQEASALRLHRLQKDLIRSQNRCRHLSDHYREISNFAFELQAQLEEAQSRGAKLCGEAKHAVCAVRHCLRRQRDRQREQEERIKKQEILIQSLQDSHTESARNAPCCSKYISSGSESSKAGRVCESEITTSPPTPPRRLHLRKSSAHVECHRVEPTTRTASVQKPTRSSCATNTNSQRCVRVCSLRNTREISPTDELLERVERAHEALAQAQRRWCHRASN